MPPRAFAARGLPSWESSLLSPTSCPHRTLKEVLHRAEGLREEPGGARNEAPLCPGTQMAPSGQQEGPGSPRSTC